MRALGKAIDKPASHAATLAAMLRRRLAVSFVLLLQAGSPLVAQAPAAGTKDDSLQERLTSALATVHRDAGVPAISAAIAVDGKIVWAEAIGERRRGGDPAANAVDAHTRFQAASISKPLTAMAAMRLVDAEKLTIDTPLKDLPGGLELPREGDADKAPRTLRHLLAHLGGTTVHGFPGYRPDETLPSIADVLAGKGNTDAVVIDAPIGTPRYSGGGYCLVQQILAATCKQSFPALMQELVLAPTGMRESLYAQPLPEKLWPLAACAHDRQGKAMAATWYVYPELAAAGLWTTPSDLLRALLAMRAAERGDEGAVLSQSAAKEMLTVQKPGSRFGLGWMVRRDGTRWMLGHSGGNQGFLCDARLTKIGDQEVGYAVMINSEQRSFSQIPRALARAVQAGRK